MNITEFKNTPEGSCIDPFSFCLQPWAGLGVTTSSSQPGENENYEFGINFKPCCKYTTPLGMTYEEYLSSPELAELKAQFLRGERPAGCIRCWEDEDNGLASRRQYLNGDIDPAKFDFDEPLPLWITAMHSTICNLACRICDSNSSSKWAAENRKFDILPTDKWNKTYHHFKNQEHMNELVALSQKLHKFTWYGGEPLLAGQDEHIAIISQLPKNITLEYLTNVTQRPSTKLLAEWEKFDDILISLSIDGIGDYFEYNRWPAKWSEIEENLCYFKELADKHPNIRLRMNFAITVLNVLHLPEFFEWNQQSGLPMTALTVVRYPFELNIRVLPESAKRIVHHKLLGTKNPALINIANYMISEDRSHLFEMTKDKVFSVDSTRNQSFEEIFPKDAKILGLINENSRNS